MSDEASLDGLLRWFRSTVADEVPARLHSRDTDAGGAPEWHAAFRAWLTAHPAATDKEGYVRSPFRYWLWQLQRKGAADGRRAQFLWRLAWFDGDWLEAGQARKSMSLWAEDQVKAYALASLRIFHGMMQTEPRVFTRGPRIEKSESQHRAEEAA